MLNRLLDLGGRPAFTLGETKIGTSLREVLEHDLELQRAARPGLNAAAEAAAGAHDATTRILLEGVLADEEEHLSWLETELALLEKTGRAALSLQPPRASPRPAHQRDPLTARQ